jgi:hypothetical protein
VGPGGSTPKVWSESYKLVIHGDVMLRPMFCKGPFDNDDEFTFLCGGIETGGVLQPDIADAEERRAVLIADPSRRERNGRYK